MGQLARQNMTYLDLAAELIEHFEGCKLKAYRCPAGILTIGYGHTGDVEEGEEITQAEAVALLMQDMQSADHCIDEYVEVGLDDDRRAALLSFIFNLGCGAFRGSTLLKLINAGSFHAAAQQFGRWTKAGGVELPGLVTRRAAERVLFEKVTA